MLLLAAFMNTSHELPTAAGFLGFVLVILVGALPATAQQPTVKLTTLADARPLDIYQPAERPPQPTLGPRFVPPVRENHVHGVLLLAPVVYVAALLDMHQTSSQLPHFHEYDALARPFLKLPTPLFYTSGMVLATGLNLAAWKMDRSPRLHRMWWVAQTASSIGNFFGYSYTKVHSRAPTVALNPD